MPRRATDALSSSSVQGAFVASSVLALLWCARVAIVTSLALALCSRSSSSCRVRLHAVSHAQQLLGATRGAPSS
jgi:hypothetical protein